MNDLRPILVVADDLSGAAELAEIAATRGLTAAVQRYPECSLSARVTAIDTDSRNSPDSLARSQMRAIAERVVQGEPVWIFKKVDSLLRGQPRAEIEALMQALGRERSLLIPANPSRGRTISDGQYLIHGQPLNETIFANDPEFPRTASTISALVTPGSLPFQTVRTPAQFPATGIAVPDIQSADDIKRWAAAVESSILPAGAADFFAAMLDRWCGPFGNQQNLDPPSLELPALLVCGSHAAWQTRHNECQAAHLAILEVGAAINADKNQIDTLTTASQIMRSQKRLVLSSGEALIPPHERAVRLQGLAQIAALVVRQHEPATLLLEGGATAAAVVSQLGWNGFLVHSSNTYGVGFLKPSEDPIAPLVVIKPGSYPWPTGIWQAFCA